MNIAEEGMHVQKRKHMLLFLNFKEYLLKPLSIHVAKAYVFGVTKSWKSRN